MRANVKNSFIVESLAFVNSCVQKVKISLLETSAVNLIVRGCLFARTIKSSISFLSARHNENMSFPLKWFCFALADYFPLNHVLMSRVWPVNTLFYLFLPLRLRAHLFYDLASSISHFLSRISHFSMSHLAFFYLASRIFHLASRIFISYLTFSISHLP